MSTSESLAVDVPVHIISQEKEEDRQLEIAESELDVLYDEWASLIGIIDALENAAWRNGIVAFLFAVLAVACWVVPLVANPTGIAMWVGMFASVPAAMLASRRARSCAARYVEQRSYRNVQRRVELNKVRPASERVRSMEGV